MTSIGPIALFGSGESAPGSHRIHHRVMKQLQPPVRVAIVETPAGFEPNSQDVAAAVGHYLEHRLQNHRPQIDIIPARKRDTAFSPDDPAIAEPILRGDYLFMGPGSPSYAVRQLRNSATWDHLIARHRLGAAVGFSSATTIALSRCALPVYEIYKVGEDLHWKEGLDFFAPFGLALVVIPHWNNNDGGDKVDTSRCYMGVERYRRLAAMLPPDITILGIDENTGVIIRPQKGRFEIAGRGGVVVVRGGVEERLPPRQTYPTTLLGNWRLPATGEGIPAPVWRAALDAQEQDRSGAADAPPEVLALVQERESARERRDWDTADRLRDQVLDLGWTIMDAADGPQLMPAVQEELEPRAH